MIVRGQILGNAPYFEVELRSGAFEGEVWMLADTGATRTTLLDRDFEHLRIPLDALEPAPTPVVGVGGSARSLLLRDVELLLRTDEDTCAHRIDLWIVRHELERLSHVEAQRILRLPSLLGRDLINQYVFTFDFRARSVHLSR